MAIKLGQHPLSDLGAVWAGFIFVIDGRVVTHGSVLEEKG